jgi:HTH-type transcriptional regulator/antitoxin HigA
MGLVAVSPHKYRALVAKALPKVIETDEELEHFAEMLESLDRLQRELTPEEKALEALLAELIQDYDDRFQLPDGPPFRVVLHLMEHRGMRPADLVPVLGSRSVTSAVLSGKRELSKSHIKKLPEFFRLSPAVFF